MKKLKYILTVLVIFVVSTTVEAQSYRVREQALFLTDKMTYELGLNSRQFADVYEVNYDFILATEALKYDILRGSNYATERYYQLLNYRNQDIYWILNSRQYRMFSGRTYFYRPIALTGNNWGLRVFINYSNRNHYYNRPPVNYRSYQGRSYRNRDNRAYYKNRYNHSKRGSYRSYDNGSRRYNTALKEDFGYRSNRSNRQGATQSTMHYKKSESNQRVKQPSRNQVSTRPNRSGRENVTPRTRVNTRNTESTTRSRSSSVTTRGSQSNTSNQSSNQGVRSRSPHSMQSNKSGQRSTTTRAVSVNNERKNRSRTESTRSTRNR